MSWGTNLISTATKILFLTQIFQTVNITIHPLQLIVVARRVPAPVRERPPDGPVHNGRRGEPIPVPVGRRNPNRHPASTKIAKTLPDN